MRRKRREGRIEGKAIGEGTEHGAAGLGPGPAPGGLKQAAAFLCGTLVFGLAHTQAPLYYSNQNQYFLHGLAAGGLGFLDHDWLANTADPTPVFSAVVAFTYRHLGTSPFHAYYLLALGVYFHAALRLFAVLSGQPPPLLARLGFATLFVAVHAGLPRLVSVRLLGTDYPWYFQAGVAGQYLLGPVLQPSVAGVLLVASVPLFLQDRPRFAAACCAFAAILHATYFLPAAFLVGSYLFVLGREKRGREALFVGGGALLFVLPAVAYHLATFGPTSTAVSAEARRLLAHDRIPHHALPERWFDAVAAAQIAWILAALGLVWRARLFPILALPFLLALLGTLLQIGTGSDTLALLFPWRISAVLVPVATAVILARLVRIATPWLRRRPPRQAWRIGAACATVLGGLVAGGVAIMYFGLAYHSNVEEVPLLEYVRDHKRPGEVYLLPVEVPPVGTGRRGVLSTSFMPPPRRGKKSNLISVDLQRFRLVTGTPIFVDFKSIPYRDVEVLEWWGRLGANRDWYARRDWDALRAELLAHGITHVVTPASTALRGSVPELVYEDASYRVYRLR